MKSFFLLSLLFCSKVLLAAELPKLVLSDKRSKISADQVTLIRNASTPDKVKIKLLVPSQSSQCVEQGTRMVYGQNGSYCGYDTAVVQRCNRECHPARPPHGGNEDPSKIPTVCDNVCRPVQVTHARACYYPETYCARYGTVTNMIEDQVTIKFKDGGLGGSEEEEYLLVGAQKHFGFNNIVFELKSTKVQGEVEIKSTDILGLGDIITVKKR
ncbi:MAG: hypothetical protein ACOYL6_12775 [Bacteriovoracaceae bacterium]